MEAAEALEKQLEAAGVDVLIDDRDQRPGVKFKDADLIGIPLRVVIGERGPEGRDDRGQVADRRRRAPRRGGDGRRGDPGRAGRDPQGGTSSQLPSSAGSPPGRDEGDDEPAASPRLPYRPARPA